MKTKVFTFKQAVLGIAYLSDVKEIENYSGRIEEYGNYENDYYNIVTTSENEMSSFEKMIVEEWENNGEDYSYEPTLTGILM